MMRKGILFFLRFLFLLLMIGEALEASEIDSFTRRHLPLRDSLDLLNQKMNEMLFEAAQLANQKDKKAKKFCQESNLYASVDQIIGGRPRGKIEIFIEDSDLFDKHYLTRSESLYADFSFVEAPALYLANLGSMINMQGLYIGTDKFGHFAAQGWIYFNEKHIKKKGLEGALQWGENSEAGSIGKKSTGIYSHGDLSANYQGLVFFERLLGNVQNPEEMAQQFPPYFICKDQQWILHQTFDWQDYINRSWDEGFNCNDYNTEKLLGKVNKRLEELSQETNSQYQCPLEKGLCQMAMLRYPEAIAKRIFSPRCQ